MQPVFELFSDIFAYRDNTLTRIDPRVKLVLAVLAIVCVITCKGFAFPLVVFSACLACMLAVRMPAGLLLVRLLAPLGMVIVLILLQSLLIGSTPLFSIYVFGAKVGVMQEGALRGIFLGARVLGAVSVLLLLSSTTRAHQIFHAMHCMGVPKGWVEVAMIMYRYIFMLMEQAGDVMDAQRVRLGYSTLRRALSSSGSLAGTVMKIAMEQGIRTCEAMELRGYKGSMPFGSMPRMSSKDWQILCLASGTLVIAYIGLEWSI